MLPNHGFIFIQMSFQNDAISSLSDWLRSPRRVFDWMRAQCTKHQFENLSKGAIKIIC